jgi:hypothetical protein
MKTHGEIEVQLHQSWYLHYVEATWSASHPDRFLQEERTPGTNQMGGWVDPSSGLDNLTPAGNRSTGVAVGILSELFRLPLR